jgi:hypothetical protein
VLGTDGARTVLDALEAGKRAKDIQPIMLPFIQRHAAMPAKERAAYKRKVRRSALRQQKSI